MRMRKKKNSAARMEACSDIKTDSPKTYKGKWNESFAKGRKLCLEIGCGKGTFVTENAKRHPEKFFVAVELVPDVILLAMEKAKREEISNVIFVCFDASAITDVFEDNELDELYLNFSDPWPKKRHAKRRLTYISFLEKYKKILKPDGKIFFKTDNRPLFDFSLEQFELAAIPVSDVTNDLHASPYESDNIHTEYEDTFSAKGFTINRLVGTVVKNKSNTALNFRKALPCDLDAISEIYDEIHTLEEARKVTTGWKREIYPTRDTAEQSILAGDMFVEEDGGEIVAAARINKEQVTEYADAEWNCDAPDERVMVLHALAVSQKVKGRGYGSAFVAFYEDYALRHNCEFLRMDTNERNAPARALYKKLGYTEAGVVGCTFNGIEGVKLVCLEKTLSK